MLVLGEDVGADGGVFRATDGLLQRFGPERVLDTPLAEAAIAGISVGLAAQGFRPVAEIQFTGFIYPRSISSPTTPRACARARAGGSPARWSCARPAAAAFTRLEHHSESPEAMFAHIPGLRVVIPSSPRRAYGLLLAAIRDPDPVVFLEPTRLYRAAREERRSMTATPCRSTAASSCAKAATSRSSPGARWSESARGRRRARGEGVSAEVIDVATLKPLDAETILASVSKDRPLRHRPRGAADRRASAARSPRASPSRR